MHWNFPSTKKIDLKILISHEFCHFVIFCNPFHIEAFKTSHEFVWWATSLMISIEWSTNIFDQKHTG
jgi:hypothetical protein